MIGESLSPEAGRAIAGGEASGNMALRGLDMQRLGMEVAGELGVDPNNLSAYGLTPETIREYETQLHSRGRSGSRR